ncbi:hypothetical protein B0H13DRAFT_1865633 [Mycena leptocephala]|nr:hypothetical protein B0H13DRAFT_1865633 [Mycena leptocephala]
MARYCSRECQKKAWKNHKLTCARAIAREVEKHPDGDMSHLSQWINAWREGIQGAWASFAFNLAMYPSDRLSQNCLVITLMKRLDPPTPEQFLKAPLLTFGLLLKHTQSESQLDNARVLSRDRVSKLLRSMGKPWADINTWLADERGDATAQIIYILGDIVRFLWFSYTDIPAIHARAKRLHPLHHVLEQSWQNGFREAVDAGNDTSAELQELRA